MVGVIYGEGRLAHASLCDFQAMHILLAFDYGGALERDIHGTLIMKSPMGGMACQLQVNLDMTD